MQLPSSRFCSSCGLTLAELRQSSRVGCASCYEAFKDLLTNSIKRLHGATSHLLAVPGAGLTALPLPRPPFAAESLEPGQLAWLSGKGAQADVVLSSRLRLARNLAGETFPGAASPEHRQRVCQRISEAIAESFKGWGVLPLWRMSAQVLALYAERHLVPRSFPHSLDGLALASSAEARLGAVINEEDHLRLQSLDAGLTLRRDLAELEYHCASLDRSLSFAGHPSLGYLTACPSNLGSGLRASVLLHLPALAWLDSLAEVARTVASSGGLTLRGPFGESSELGGPLLQLSNQITLGRSDIELIAEVEKAALSLADWERRARERIAAVDRTRLEDACWRAWGTLSHARLVDQTECLELLSTVRLGQLCYVLPDSAVSAPMASLLVASQPAHLRTWRHLDSKDQLDCSRARWLRAVFAPETRR